MFKKSRSWWVALRRHPTEATKRTLHPMRPVAEYYTNILRVAIIHVREGSTTWGKVSTLSRPSVQSKVKYLTRSAKIRGRPASSSAARCLRPETNSIDWTIQINVGVLVDRAQRLVRPRIHDQRSFGRNTTCLDMLLLYDGSGCISILECI